MAGRPGPAVPPEPDARPGRDRQFAVDAATGWVATGLYLEPGAYQFTAAGEWRTPFGRCGPRGLTPWPVVGDAFGHVVDLVERGLRGILRKPEAELAGARRKAHEPLMALIGVVANEVTDAEGKVAERDGKLFANQELVIGDGADVVVSEPGYLWAYANDAWGAYGNNRGAVTLTVRRSR